MLAVLLLAILLFNLKDKSPELSFIPLELNIQLLNISLCLLGLGILNWSLEAIKWYSLIKKLQKLSPGKIAASILIGISSNIILPQRSGDIAGRLKYIDSGNRWKALYLNFVAANSQALITFIIGMFAALWFLDQTLLIKSLYVDLFKFLALFLALLSTALFLFSNLIKKAFIRFKGFIHQSELQDLELPSSSRFRLMIFSLLRYMVFSLQFYLITVLLQAEMSFFSAFLAISLIFFVNSFVPSNWLTELLAKGSFAYFIFDWMSLDPWIGISATLILWLINIFIPSLVGLYFLKDVNWLRLMKKFKVLLN